LLMLCCFFFSFVLIGILLFLHRTRIETLARKVHFLLLNDFIQVNVPELRLPEINKEKVCVRVYCSKLTEETDLQVFWDETKSFASKNMEHDITGFLFVNMDTREAFQMLEGEEFQVDALYARICNDTRHEIQHTSRFRSRRIYNNWGMVPFKFTVPVEGGNASKRLWKELMQMREIRVEKPHWGNLFKDGFLGPYFVTTVDIDDTGKLQYHTRPFNFVQVLENGNNTRMMISILRERDGSMKKTLSNLNKYPFVTISIISDWANDHFYNHFREKFPQYDADRKMGGKHWFDTVLIRNDEIIVESGFHFSNFSLKGQDYANVFPAERMFFCEATNSLSSVSGKVTSEQVFLKVHGVGIREFKEGNLQDLKTSEEESGTDRGFWDSTPKCSFSSKKRA